VPREQRLALRARKAPRPHPAAPQAATNDAGADPAARVRADRARDGELVMFCVRVPRSLRRQAKIPSAPASTSVQALGIAALQAECRRHGM
jgi:hypothetical protein